MVDDGDGFDKGCTRQVGEAEISQHQVHLGNKVHMVNTNIVANMIMTHGMMRIH